MIAALPAALSFRFGFGAAFEVGVAVGVADACGSGLPFFAAHRLRWASAMALRPAALIFRRGGFVDTGVGADSAGSPERNARSSAIWASIPRFCSSKPRMAAATISFVSFGVGMSLRYVFSHSDMILFCVENADPPSWRR